MRASYAALSRVFHTKGKIQKTNLLLGDDARSRRRRCHVVISWHEAMALLTLQEMSQAWKELHNASQEECLSFFFN